MAVVPTGCDARFLYYWFTTIDMTRLANPGPVPSVNESDVAALSMPLPTPPVQEAITDFLYAECAAIDRLIDHRQRVATLLDDRLAATIDNAVSGVAGETNLRLKHLLRRPLQYGAAEPVGHEERAWPRYIRTTDIDDDGSLRPDTFQSLSPDVARNYMLEDGDLLFTRSGATVGKSILFAAEWGPACFAGYLIRAAIDRRKALPAFVAYFARSSSYWAQIGGATIQATIQNVNAERYGDLRLPVPTLGKQAEIVSFLDSESGRTRHRKALMEVQKLRLAERRQALITAAVTGQIAIPGAART